MDSEEKKIGIKGTRNLPAWIRYTKKAILDKLGFMAGDPNEIENDGRWQAIVAYGQFMMDNIQPTDYFQCSSGVSIQKLVCEAATVGLQARSDFLELDPRPIPEPLGVTKEFHKDDQRQRGRDRGLPPRGNRTGNTDQPEDGHEEEEEEVSPEAVDLDEDEPQEQDEEELDETAEAGFDFEDDWIVGGFFFFLRNF